MRRVGLVTFHHLNNFGAFWQAWCLVQTLERLDSAVRVIDYRPKIHEARRTGFRACLPSLGRLRMRRFMTRTLPLSETLRTHAEVAAHVDSSDYDYIVCGSDQIWMVGDHMKFDGAYFLDFGNTIKARRIAYAPSCGSIRSFGDHRTFIRSLLDKFHAVSARDGRTLACLAEIGIEPVVRVVDPTLLADFDEFVRPRTIEAEYVAVVGRMNDQSSCLARDVADRLGCMLVAAGTLCPMADRVLRFAHQGQWLNCLANSRFVVTSLYHGTVLALRFGKPFLAVDAGGRGFKLADLLEHFALEDRFVQQEAGGGYALQPRMLEFDLESARDRIQNAVDASLVYLRRALYG